MISNIIDKLAATSSRNEKVSILHREQDNKLLQNVLKAALDPYINYNIFKIPEYIPSLNPSLNLEQSINELNRLSSRQLTGNAGIEHLRWILSETNEPTIIQKIIQRDLKCGVSDKTVNAVWPDLIPEFPCMLCSQYEDKLIDKLKFPIRVETKLDGGRIIIIRDSGLNLYSRNGKIVEVSDQVINELLKLPDQYVYDGECLFVDSKGKFLSRKASNGLFNKCIKNTASEEETSRMRFVLWDMIPIHEFRNTKGITSLQQRVDLLEQTIHSNPSLFYKLVKYQYVNTIDQALSFYNQERQNGEEGIILKDLRNVFENKRVKNFVKLKAEVDIDVKVIDWCEGTGKNIGRLGALTVETSDRKIKCNVGSGFTDEQRSEFTPDKIVGKIISITYNDIIIDKRTGELSFFLPIFQQLRLDKDQADRSPM